MEIWNIVKKKIIIELFLLVGYMPRDGGGWPEVDNPFIQQNLLSFK